MKQNAIIKSINDILLTGTRVVSFNWYGKTFNVTIGSNRVYDYMSNLWKCDCDEVINKAIVKNKNNNKFYLYGIDNNNNNIIFSWDISNIRKASFLTRNHFPSGLLGWFGWKLSKVF